MTEQNRTDRIKHLRQQADRKHFLTDFKLSFSKIIGQSNFEDFILTQDNTNKLIKKIHEKNSQIPTLSITYPFDQSEKIRTILTSLKGVLMQSDNYFSTYKFFKAFFLQFDTSFVIREFEKLVELDTNTIYVYDNNINNGFWIDCNEENWTENGETRYVWTYELRVWGKEWVSKVYEQYLKAEK